MKNFTRFVFFLCLVPVFIFSQVLKVDMGKVDEVEFIGLEQWTPQMVLDSFTNCSDSTCFKDGTFKIYCNYCIKDRLPFASVHAQTFLKKDRKLKVVIFAVEPQYKSILKYTKLPVESKNKDKRWSKLDTAVHDMDLSLQAVLQFYYVLAEAGRDSVKAILKSFEEYGIDSVDVKKCYENIRSFNKKEDFVNAVTTLRTDANQDNRKPALCVLANFPENPGTYSALFDALAAEGDRGNETVIAELVMASLIKMNKPDLNIIEFSGSLKPLLMGANIQHFLNVMEFLSSVKHMDKESRHFILKYSKRLCVNYLKSQSFSERIKKCVEILADKNFNSSDDCIAYLETVM